MTRRLVISNRDVETLEQVEGVPLVLLPEGTYERLASHLDPSDDEAIAAHYGVEEVVRPGPFAFCRAVVADGPEQGAEIYAVRRVGATVTLAGGTYVVTDDQPEVVPLRYTGAEE